MTSMTWSPAQQALTAPATAAFATHAWTYVCQMYVETADVVFETLGSVGLELSAPEQIADALSSQIQRDIGQCL